MLWVNHDALNVVNRRVGKNVTQNVIAHLERLITTVRKESIDSLGTTSISFLAPMQNRRKIDGNKPASSQRHNNADVTNT